MTSDVQGRTLVDRVVRHFRAGRRIRLPLADGGGLSIDRKLPFLLVYRQPAGRDDAGTASLVRGEAAWLVAREQDPLAAGLVKALAEAGTEEFGAFLVIELWSGAQASRSFVVHAPQGPGGDTTDAMSRALAGMPAIPGCRAPRLSTGEDRQAPDMEPLLTAHECWRIGCLLIGLEVPPLYRDGQGNLYPVFLRRLRGLISTVLRRSVASFARVHTTADIGSYRALGPARFGEELTGIDRELAAIEGTFELLLLVSPINPAEAWRSFRASGFQRAPEFHYRLLPVDPDILRRRLFNIDLDRVPDPAMAFLLTDKRDELDRQLTLIAERNTPDFLYGSIRLYRPVEANLLATARELLDGLPPTDRDQAASVDAHEFADLARAEIRRYRAALPDMTATVQVRPDLTGLLVSRGNLLIGDTLALRPGRVQALLHHEVGTHVLTWFNGRAQPLQQLATGLAGYDELQEALAVFAEYLAGGLDSPRLRLLAARVVAAHSVEQGADFVATFRTLTGEHGIPPGEAFDVAERVHASGGFTRDLIYLRGLVRLLDYLAAGGELAPLYIGKMAHRHMGVIGELRERGFLRPSPLVPAIFAVPGAAGRLEAARQGISLTDLAGS
jgi:uncharacterized protein (TIGR02421 family)